MTAVEAARTRDRNFMNRWGMPGSFRGAESGLLATEYAAGVRVSTIAKHHGAGSGSPFAKALGLEIKRRRIALGLSQASVGQPLSRAFMSSVESGRLTPSLPSLLMIARRLDSSGAAILASVESQLEVEFDDGTADETAIPR